MRLLEGENGLWTGVFDPGTKEEGEKFMSAL
jgi:hypothetical protein